MTSTDIVFIPGTGEPNGFPDGHPAGMLWGVGHELNRLAPGRFRFHTIDYRKQYVGPGSYGDSRADGVAKTHALLDRVGGGRTVGYSMGATVAGDVAAVRGDVPCGYLLADPLRPKGANSTGSPGQRGYAAQELFTGYGIGGQRRVEVARWYSIVGDIITDATADNLVRTFADFTEFLGFAEFNDLEQLRDDILSKIRNQAFQNLPWYRRIAANPVTLLGMPQALKNTVQQGLGYPKIHCDYGTRMFLNHGRTYIQELARDIAIDAGVLHP